MDELLNSGIPEAMPVVILKTRRKVSAKKAAKVKAKYLATGRLPLGWHVEDVVR